MSVTPQVILGEPPIGLGGDNLRQALGKYNEHTHLPAQTANPLDTGVVPGAVVQSLDCDSLFPDGTTVLSVSAEVITLSASATQSRVCSLQLGDRIINRVQATIDSPEISVLNLSGFQTGARVLANNTQIITGLIPASVATYPLLLATPWAGTLDRISLVTVTGTASVALKLDGRTVSNVNVTTTAQTVSLINTVANRTDFAAETDITLQVTVVNSSPLIHYSLYLLAWE